MKNEKVKMKDVGKQFLFLVLFCLFSVSVYAQERVVDNAGLLSSQEKTSLTELIKTTASKYNFDLFIVTEGSFDINDMAVDAYVDSLFNSGRYGLSEDKDACLLFVQVAETKNYRISETGRGMAILNQTAFDKLDNDTVKNLREGRYYDASCAFILDWQEFLELESNGRNFNFFYQWNLLLVCIAWAFALLIGFWVVSTWKSNMNTAVSPAQAGAYVVSGSLNYSEEKDTFLYSNTSKTSRESSSSSMASLSSGSAKRRSRGGRF